MSRHDMVVVLGFTIRVTVFTLVAHALAYLLHEYAHSLSAWAWGWMPGPFAIDYGPLTLSNLLFLGDVSDNVDYARILACGHPFVAALVALAGPFIGNGLAYALVWQVWKRLPLSAQRTSTSLLYWLALMCAGNVWSYVPLRAITTHADIAIAAHALGVSVYVLFVVLMVPSLYIVRHFFMHVVRRMHASVSGGQHSAGIVVFCLTGFWFFSFFGGDGISGTYGYVSQLLCMASRYVLFPLSVAWMVHTYGTQSVSSDKRIPTP